MTDVLSTNFEALLPEIHDSIENASFIAIDTEFTGLISSSDNKSSLFDDGEQRYHKLRENVSKYIVCQFGLATFRNDKVANRYWCHTYNFYLHPPSFGSIDNVFSCQPSSLEFLTGHGFDFNKWIAFGIPYLNDNEEEIITKEIKHKTFLLETERHEASCELQMLCSAVSEWITSSKEEELLLEKIAGVQDFIQANEIRYRFPNVWASVNSDGKITVRRISREQRTELEEHSVHEDETMVTCLLGFTRVFRALVKARKPIVGHNMLMDLLFMYHHFYKALPKNYEMFKVDLQKLFPEVYDTKSITFNIRKKLERTNIVEMSSLEEIYRNFLKPTFSVLYVPHIVIAGHATNDTGPKIKPHEAGFDAYATGYIFLRIAHILAMENVSPQEARPLSWSSHYGAVAIFVNKVNLIRAVNHCMDLSGPDPKSERPQWLVVKGKRKNCRLNPTQVAELFSRFGCVDVKPLDENQMLVAVGSFGCVREILRVFHSHETIEVSHYSRLRHSRPLRLFLWSTWLLSSGFSLYLIFKVLKPSFK